MQKELIYFSMILVIVSIMIITVNAETAEDLISQQIKQGNLNVNYQLSASDVDPQIFFKQAIEQNPEIRKAFITMMTVFFIAVIVLIIDMILTGLAMWKAAKKDSKAMFWILFIIRTLGILPLLYLILSKSPGEKAKKK